MINSTKIFEKQFEPVEGGYLYYPSKRSGGKLVTTEEYDTLVKNWKSVSQGKFFWGMMGGFCSVLLILTIFDAALNLPEWSTNAVIYAAVIAMSSYLVWFSFAPRRLVKGRKDIAPPRKASESRKAARAVLPWPFVIFGLVGTTTLFIWLLGQSPDGLVGWAITAFSGIFSGMYAWIAFAKFRDGRR